MNMKETLIVNTNSEKKLNTGRRINYLVLMITLVVCNPIQYVVPVISGITCCCVCARVCVCVCVYVCRER